MVGYYGDEAATRAAFTDDGFLRTGISATRPGRAGSSSSRGSAMHCG